MLTRNRKVSQLEERIETLTKLITSGKAVFTASNTESPPAETALPTPPVSSTQDSNGQGELGAVLECGYWQRTSTQGIRVPLERDGNSMFSVCIPEAYQEKLLEFFRTEMNHHFPFVVVPSVLTPGLFRQDHPFLFRACIAAAAHCDPPTQMRLGEDLLKTIGERMLVRSEKSLDLLQGLLVLIGW